VFCIVRESVEIFICEQQTGVIFSLAIIMSQSPFEKIFDYLKKILYVYISFDLRAISV